MATAVRASRHPAGMERSVVYTDGMPGPDGPAAEKTTDSGSSNPGLELGEDQMSADLSTVKRSIRSLF